MAKEPDWNDIVYVSKMILIYAAAKNLPSILEEAPSFFAKHLNYLGDKYPEFFAAPMPALAVKKEEQTLLEKA